MTLPSTATAMTSGTTASPSKPRDEELDFFGMTHPGKVRVDNQDHYLVSTLHKTARVRSTSLPNPELFELPSQRIASFGMVADGVGGHQGGEPRGRGDDRRVREGGDERVLHRGRERSRRVPGHAASCRGDVSRGGAPARS